MLEIRFISSKDIFTKSLPAPALPRLRCNLKMVLLAEIEGGYKIHMFEYYTCNVFFFTRSSGPSMYTGSSACVAHD